MADENFLVQCVCHPPDGSASVARGRCRKPEALRAVGMNHVRRVELRRNGKAARGRFHPGVEAFTNTKRPVGGLWWQEATAHGSAASACRRRYRGKPAQAIDFEPLGFSGEPPAVG